MPARSTNCADPMATSRLSLESASTPIDELSLPFDPSGQVWSTATEEAFEPPRIELGDVLVLHLERAP